MRSKTLLLSGLLLLISAYLMVRLTHRPVFGLSVEFSFFEKTPTILDELCIYLVTAGGLSLLFLPFSLIRDLSHRNRKQP